MQNKSNEELETLVTSSMERFYIKDKDIEKEILSIPKLTREKLVTSLQPGDVILVYPRLKANQSTLSYKLNSFVQGMAFSSIKLIGCNNDVIGYNVRETLTLDKATIKSLPDRFKGILILRHKEITSDIAKKIYDWVYDKLLKKIPYDYIGVLKALAKRLLHITGLTIDTENIDNFTSKLYCSTVIHLGFKAANLSTGIFSIGDLDIFPKDFLSSDKFTKVGLYLAKGELEVSKEELEYDKPTLDKLLDSISKMITNTKRQAFVPLNILTEYYDRTKKHQELVRKCGELLKPILISKGIDITEFDNILAKHDWDKLNDLDIIPIYAVATKYLYYNDNTNTLFEPKEGVLDEFDNVAWPKHYKTNAHHVGEHFGTLGRTIYKYTVVDDNHPLAITEMIADWMAVGLKVNTTANDWWKKCLAENKYDFQENDTKLLEELLTVEIDKKEELDMLKASISEEDIHINVAKHIHNDIVYHGSPFKVDILKNDKSKTEGESKGVFVTPFKGIAACFVPNEKDLIEKIKKQGMDTSNINFQYSKWNEDFDTLQNMPTTLEIYLDNPILKPFTGVAVGYIYTIDYSKYKDKTRMFKQAENSDIEFIIDSDVIPINCEKVSIPYIVKHPEDATIDDRVKKVLSTLSTYKYGIYIKDIGLITDPEKFHEFKTTDLLIQAPELFEKNKCGMCHDATVYLHEKLTKWKIPHKCIYLESSKKPYFPTHSFVVAELFKDMWYTLDVFAVPGCIYTQGYPSWELTSNIRIKLWLSEEQLEKYPVKALMIKKFSPHNSNIELFMQYMNKYGVVYNVNRPISKEDLMLSKNPTTIKEIIEANKPESKISIGLEELSISTEAAASGKKKAILDYICKMCDLMDPSKLNSDRYKKLINGMTDKQFNTFMNDMKDGKFQMHIVAPNMKVNLQLKNMLAASDALKLKLFHKIWMKDSATGKKFLSDNEYLVVQLPVRRQEQFIDKKLSVPDNDRSIDGLTGQVSWDSKACSITNPEIQILAGRNMDAALYELVNVRGGNINSYAEFKRSLEENGEARLNDLDPTSRSRVAVMGGVLLTAMLIDNNL